MVINKKVSKTKIFYYTGYLFPLTFVGAAFVEMAFVGKVVIGADFVELAFVGTVFITSFVSSHVITESPKIMPKYLPFSLVHVVGFQIQLFSHK